MAADGHAQTYYVALGAGGGHIPESRVTLAGAGGVEAGFDDGPAASAAFGFAWIDGWRIEAEWSWRRNDFATLAGAATAGRIEAQAAMVNLFYGLRRDGRVNPYLGVGAGAARIAVAGLPAGASVVDDAGIVPAWQAGGGVDVVLSGRATLSLDLRYLVANGVELSDEAGQPFEADYRAVAALLGLRLGF